VPPRGGPWKRCCLPNGGSHRLELIGTKVFLNTRIVEHQQLRAGLWRRARASEEDGPGLRAQWPVLFLWRRTDCGAQWGMGVEELGLDDTVLMATMSLARHTCWVGVGSCAGKQGLLWSRGGTRLVLAALPGSPVPLGACLLH